MGAKWCHLNENAVSDGQFAKSRVQNPRIQRGNCIVIEKIFTHAVQTLAVQVLTVIWKRLKKENLENAGGRYEKQVIYM